MLVRAFGGIDIEPVQGRRSAVTARRPRLLLAVLASRAGSVVSDGAIAEAIWGDRPPASMRTAMQTYVSALRDLLEPDRERHHPGRYIAYQGGGYRLDVGPDDLDLVRFERNIDGAADVHRSDPAVATALLLAALDLWSDPPLGEFAEEPWALPVVARLRDRHAAAIEARVGLALDAGSEDEVVGRLEEATATYPYRERLAGQLMLVHHRRGDQQRALATYARIRRALRDDLGLEPAAELRLLERAILDQDPALQRRERVLASAPPVAVREHTTDQLPPARRLTGRDEELEAVESLLTATRCVTLSGPGGVGKSALAANVAHAFRRRFGVSVHVVDLARHRSRSVLRAIAVELRVVEHPLAPLAYTVADALAARPTLLVLDTCEVAPQDVADAAAQLAAVPGLRLLLTSQVPVGAPGESVHRLGPLESEAAIELLERAARSGAVDHPADETVRAQLAAIAERVDRMPLGLELAAARLVSLGPSELLRSLERGFDVLVAPDNRTARQQSVVAAAEWSVGLLQPPRMHALTMLCAFVAPVSLDVAEALCEARVPALAGVVGDLVDRSLVQRLGGLGGGTTRFRVPDPVRAAVGTVAGDEVDEWRAALVELVNGVAQAEFLGRSPASTLHLAALGGEIMPSLDRMDELGDERLLLLTGFLASYFQTHGLVSEGRERLGRAIERFPQASPVLVVAAAAQAGFLAWYQGDGRACRRLLDEIESRLDEVPLTGFADTVRGCRAFSHGDHVVAADHLDAAADTAAGLPSQRLLLLNLAGNTAWYAGRLDAAARRYRQQGELADDVGDVFHQAQSLRFSAMLAAQRDDDRRDIDRAWRWAERSRQMSATIDDPMSMAQSAAALAVVAAAAGDLSAAAHDAAVAVQLSRRQFDVFALRTALPLLARQTLDEGDVVRAGELAGWYLDLLDRTGQGPSMAVSALADQTVDAIRSALGAVEFARASARGAARTVGELADDISPGRMR